MNETKVPWLEVVSQRKACLLNEKWPFSVFKLFFRILKGTLGHVSLGEKNWKNVASLIFDTQKALITSGHPVANHQLKFVQMTPRFAWDPNPDNFATVPPAYRPCCRRCIKVSTTFNCNGQKYDEVDGRLFPEEYWH